MTIIVLCVTSLCWIENYRGVLKMKEGLAMSGAEINNTSLTPTSGAFYCSSEKLSKGSATFSVIKMLFVCWGLIIFQLIITDGI